MTKEQKFYNALKSIFVGAEVEGESGYINLMRVKSRYYEKGVFPKLQGDIEEALKPFPEFREELFDKLYTFFNRYFSESGSIYFRYTPIHQNVYEKVYTNDKDVILFWKTHMLYYVKTDRLFKNLEVEIDDFKFFFDVSTLEHKKANEKREIVYEFKKKRRDGTIVFNVSYSVRGKKTKIAEILRALNREGVRITEDSLENAFRVFEKQSEVDYFINRNAREFLREQFNIWTYQYVFSGESEWTEKRIKQLQALKDIAFKIIDFIAQFEDELVKVWNKPKFVLNSNYVITLDRIVSASRFEQSKESLKVIERILEHENFNEQIKEWKDLGIIDGDFDKSRILENTLVGKQLNKKYQYLPIDTKYFKDLELEILGLFENLDNALDGWLIKSENYQALNTILPKFKEKVQTIYIDPPYNTGSDEFIYRDKFQHSSWLTMMENRLSLTKEIMMKDNGIIFVSIGDTTKSNIHITSTSKLITLMNEIFDEDNYVATFVRKSGIAPRQDIKHVANAHDYIVSYAKEIDL
ncbi:MAG: DNA methyltransferase, partial [Thermotogota bacterium]|nr:DNA methyltransferase [Thermotogota bacterium]